MGHEVQCRTEQQAVALTAVIGERDYQDRKWGTPEVRPHEVGSYLTLMRVHLSEAEVGFATNNHDMVALEEMRKVVAIGLACFEQHGVPFRQ